MTVFAVMADNSCNYDDEYRGVNVVKLCAKEETAKDFVGFKKLFQKKDDQTSYYVRPMEVEEGDTEDMLGKAGLGPKSIKKTSYKTTKVSIKRA